MQLVDEMQNLTNPAAHSTAAKIHALQETFLVVSKTGQFQIQPHLVHQKDKIYATLRQFLSTQTGIKEDNQKPFHAVSAMAKKVGFIIRYLPPHHDAAQTVMARISANLLGISEGPNQSVSYKPQVPSAPPTANNPSSAPVPHQQLAVMHLATAQSKLKLNCGMTQKSRPKCTLSHEVGKPMQQREGPIARTTSPSHNDKYRWLVAVLKYFQNTAWDKWRYRNGIQDRRWRKSNLPVGLG